MRTVSIFNQTFSADTEKAGYKKEAALKREEERKRSIELMKKKWLSQYKSLGLKKNGTGAIQKTDLLSVKERIMMPLPI